MTGSSIISFPFMGREPSADKLAEHVRALAVDSFNVRMDEPHFRDALAEAGLGMRQVLEVLRNGRAIGYPELDRYGDYRIRMVRKVAGTRVVVVVAVCADHVVCVTTW